MHQLWSQTVQNVFLIGWNQWYCIFSSPLLPSYFQHCNFQSNPNQFTINYCWVSNNNLIWLLEDSPVRLVYIFSDLIENSISFNCFVASSRSYRSSANLGLSDLLYDCLPFEYVLHGNHCFNWMAFISMLECIYLIWGGDKMCVDSRNAKMHGKTDDNNKKLHEEWSEWNCVVYQFELNRMIGIGKENRNST